MSWGGTTTSISSLATAAAGPSQLQSKARPRPRPSSVPLLGAIATYEPGPAAPQGGVRRAAPRLQTPGAASADLTPADLLRHRPVAGPPPPSTTEELKRGRSAASAGMAGVARPQGIPGDASGLEPASLRQVGPNEAVMASGSQQPWDLLRHRRSEARGPLRCRSSLAPARATPLPAPSGPHRRPAAHFGLHAVRPARLARCCPALQCWGELRCARLTQRSAAGKQARAARRAAWLCSPGSLRLPAQGPLGGWPG